MKTATNEEHSQVENAVELGYFVPEEAWYKFEQAREAFAAINDIANQASDSITLNSDHIKSLFDVFQEHLQHVHQSGRFCTRPLEESTHV